MPGTAIVSGAARGIGPSKPRIALRSAPPDGISLSRRRGVAVLRIDLPNPGLWQPDVRSRILECLDALLAEAATDAVVLTGAAVFTDAGDADIAAFTDLLGVISASATKVLAAIPGPARGAGLELALACHGRIATSQARFSLPDACRGTLPVNGAIERLGTLVGPLRAAEMIAFGEVVAAPAALRIGLIDALAAADLLGEAVAIAAGAARPIGASPPAGSARQFADLRAWVRRRAPGQIVPLAAIQALEHARRLPLERSLAETRRLALELRGTAQGAALAHAAVAEARLGRSDIAGLADRLRWPLVREAIHLIDEGATPLQVDRALVRFGFTAAPLAAIDQTGLAAFVTASAPVWQHYSPTLDLMLDAGRHGAAAGRGWYRYGADRRRPMEDPDLDRLLRDSAYAQRLRRRPVTDAEILERCLAAAAAAARPLGVAAAEIDAISTTHLGFPRWRGGLMHYSARL